MLLPLGVRMVAPRLAFPVFEVRLAEFFPDFPLIVRGLVEGTVRPVLDLDVAPRLPDRFVVEDRFVAAPRFDDVRFVVDFGLLVEFRLEVDGRLRFVTLLRLDVDGRAGLFNVGIPDGGLVLGRPKVVLGVPAAPGVGRVDREDDAPELRLVAASIISGTEMLITTEPEIIEAATTEIRTSMRIAAATTETSTRIRFAAAMSL